MRLIPKLKLILFMNRAFFRLLTMLPLMFVACASETGHAFEISNFKSGLVCSQNSESENISDSSICFDSRDVYITGQSRCAYNGEDRPCTWYGFEFDYKNASTNDVILCISRSDVAGDIGNPNNVEKENTKTSQFTITLEPGDGHFYNPQYSIFTYVSQKNKIVTDQTTCSLRDAELFQYKFRLIYPQME